MSILNAILTKFAPESDLFNFDCSQIMATGDVISGTPVLSFEPAVLTGADALTFGVPAINGTDITFVDGRVGRAGCVIQVRISGGTPVDAVIERDYTVIATFGTVQGNTKIARSLLQLLPLAM